jgi:hypothetical protein
MTPWAGTSGSSSSSNRTAATSSAAGALTAQPPGGRSSIAGDARQTPLDLVTAVLTLIALELQAAAA